jgi:hypothetical protein
VVGDGIVSFRSEIDIGFDTPGFHTKHFVLSGYDKKPHRHVEIEVYPKHRFNELS